MEENTSAVTGSETQDNSGDMQGKAGASGQKLFTQEEVNAFVQSRLSRYKGQIEKEGQREYDQKLQELNQREMKLLVKEQLSARDMPRELADIITCTDEADLKQKLDTLQKVYGSSAAGKKEKPQGFIQVGVGGGSGISQGPDPIRRAMGLGKD